MHNEQELELPTLPIKDILFSADSTKIIGGGFDRFPVIIEYENEETIKFKELLKQPINAKIIQQTKKIDNIKDIFNKSSIQVK